MTVVLDSSYAMALALPDEVALATRAEVLAQALIAPHLFPVEVANASLNSVRRRRYPPEDADRVCRTIEALRVDVITPSGVGPSYYARLALAHGLSACDAMYLDLALARRCPLATADVKLARAARRAGIEVLA
ncbi:MAG: type II toxin-antitoxin system VapC family toxin [Caldimonas sp.]